MMEGGSSQYFQVGCPSSSSEFDVAKYEQYERHAGYISETEHFAATTILDSIRSGPNMITIGVALSKEEKNIEIREDASIQTVKEVISRKFENIPALESFFLIFDGRIIKDHGTLQTNNIEDGMKVHLLFKQQVNGNDAANNEASGCSFQMKNHFTADFMEDKQCSNSDDIDYDNKFSKDLKDMKYCIKKESEIVRNHKSGCSIQTSNSDVYSDSSDEDKIDSDPDYVYNDKKVSNFKYFDMHKSIKKESMIADDEIKLEVSFEDDTPDTNEQDMNIKREKNEDHIEDKNFNMNDFLNVEIEVQKEIRIHKEKPFKPTECDFCHRVFRCNSVMVAHRRSHTGEKPFKCEVCFKPFALQKDLSRHTRTHTGETPYQCELCVKSFSRKDRLNAHKRIQHGEKQVFTCNVCRETFTDKDFFSEHKKSHDEEKPFTCEFCKKSFSRKYVLLKHVRTHTGERPFECEFCNKTFSWEESLTKHRRTHTGEKPYKCLICDKAFSWKDSLNKHYKCRHPTVRII